MFTNALTGRPPGLRLKNGRPVPRIVPPRLGARVAAAYPKLESRLLAEVRAAQVGASTARSHEIAVTDTSLTRNADGSATGKIGFGDSQGGTKLEGSMSFTGRPTTGTMDIDIALAVTSPSGHRVTKGFTIRDLGGGTPTGKCPSADGKLQVAGRSGGGTHSEERFGSDGVHIGTIREGVSINSTEGAQATFDSSGRLQPYTFTLTTSLDYSRTVKGLAFISSQARVAATGTMTGTMDPATGQISGVSVSTKVRTPGFDSPEVEASYHRAVEDILRKDAARLREKLRESERQCGRYEVTFAIQSTANFATHSSSGTLNTTVTSTSQRFFVDGGMRQFAQGPVNYENLVFSSKLDTCSYEDPISLSETLTVKLDLTPQGLLGVTWETDGKGPSTTATVVCRDPGPPPTEARIPGQPGVSLIQPTPTTFELPLEGGQIAIGGGFQSGGDGWTHTGTITVKRIAASP